jgi:hypothetical protein
MHRPATAHGRVKDRDVRSDLRRWPAGVPPRRVHQRRRQRLADVPVAGPVEVVVVSAASPAPNGGARGGRSSRSATRCRCGRE